MLVPRVLSRMRHASDQTTLTSPLLEKTVLFGISQESLI